MPNAFRVIVSQLELMLMRLSHDLTFEEFLGKFFHLFRRLLGMGWKLRLCFCTVGAKLSAKTRMDFLLLEGGLTKNKGQVSSGLQDEF